MRYRQVDQDFLSASELWHEGLSGLSDGVNGD
ncbi:hypothetical protein FBZ90_13220, partial [Nitrospirillum pindoramense]